MIRNNILRLCAIILFAATLSGCRLGHEYTRPQMSDMPALLSTDMPVDTFTVATMSWKQLFPDTILSALVQQTLEGNKDLAIAASRVREYAALKRVATADLLPQVTVGAYGQKESLNYGGTGAKPDPEVGLKARLTWEADLWGNLRWGREKALAEYLATEEGRKALAVTLVAEVAEAYFELVALDGELSIVRQTLMARRESVRLAKLRFEGGLTSESPYRQAQVELERTAARIPVLEEQIDIKQNQISLLSGRFPTDIARADSLNVSAIPRTLPVGMSSDMLRHRPDVRRAEAQLRAANAAVGVAYTDRFPTLTLTAEGGLESDSFTRFLKSPMYFLSAGLLGPIFDAGKRQAKYRASQEQYRQAELTYQKTVINAFTEARNAIISFRKAAQIHDSSVSLLEAAQASLNIVRKQYLAGTIAYIDLLDAQRSFLDAQLAVLDASLHRQLSLVLLYRTLSDAPVALLGS